jgi:spore coat protein CotH
MNELMTDTLVAEYETILTDLGAEATDEQIIRALVERGDWTEQGAREVLQLARRYGTSILRNALALAAAMQIEDGSVGL